MELTDRDGLGSFRPMKLTRLSGLLVALAFAAVQAQGQEGAATTTVIALGTQGGPSPNPFRSQPAHALQVAGQTYLIDAGNGVARQLVRAGIPVAQVKRVFITHNHDDHNADLGTLMGFAWSLGSMEPFEVHGPAGIRQLIEGFRRAYSVNAGIRVLDAPGRRGGISEGEVKVAVIGEAEAPKLVYRDAQVRVSAVQNCHYHHDAAESPGSAGERSYAFRFETADRVVVFSGDTGPCAPLIAFSKGADVLVHEVIHLELMGRSLRASGPPLPEPALQAMLQRSALYHTTPEEVGKLARDAAVGMVVLTHVMPGDEEDPDLAYTRGVSEHYAGEVMVARDLMRF